MDFCNCSNGFTGNIISGIPALVAIFTAILFVLSYRKSNRTKAAEIYYNLEVNFKEHIPILLDIEYDPKYISEIVSAINAVKKLQTTPAHDLTIIKLDSMLRHFHTCYQIKKLNIDGNKLDEGYIFYLRMFLRKDRAEITKYIEEYWPTVFKWCKEEVQ